MASAVETMCQTPQSLDEIDEYRAARAKLEATSVFWIEDQTLRRFRPYRG